MPPTARSPLLALLAVALFLGAFASYAAVRRNANWDLLPYVALASEAAAADAPSLHRATYAALEAELPADEFGPLTSSTAYRAACAADARVFSEQLGFYRYRLMYPWFLRGLHALGVPWRTAATWVSVLAGVALVGLAARWAWELGAGWLGLGVLALWVPASGAVDIARLWTPDTLGALFAFGGLYLWIARERPTAGAVVLVASLLARSSNVVFVALLLLALAAASVRRRERLVGLVAVAACGALYLALGRLGNGWWPMFVHTCVERVHLPRSEPPTFSVGAYLEALAAALPYLHLTKAGLWVAITATLVALPDTPRWQRLVGVSLLVSTAVQFLAAPVLWDRLFVTQELLVALLWLGRIGVRSTWCGRLS